MKPNDDDEAFAVALGASIKAARNRRGLDQEELAKRIGVAVRTMSRYETGERDASLKTVRAIARALDMDAATILGMAEDLT